MDLQDFRDGGGVLRPLTTDELIERRYVEFVAIKTFMAEHGMIYVPQRIDFNTPSDCQYVNFMLDKYDAYIGVRQFRKLHKEFDESGLHRIRFLPKGMTDDEITNLQSFFLQLLMEVEQNSVTR